MGVDNIEIVEISWDIYRKT